MIRLYGYWRSSSTWRVRLALALKAVPYELIPVNLAPGVDDQTRPGFEEISPLRQVPVLELLSGERLRQSMAILDYLEAIYPEPPLFPTDPLSRAYALEAAELVVSGIQPLQNPSTFEQVEAHGGDRATFAGHFIARGLEALERLVQLRGGTYSVGDSLSVADVTLIPQLYNARRFGVDVGAFTKLLEVEARCNALEPFRAAHPDAQPDKPARIEAPTPKARLSRLVGLHYYVHDLERSRRFYVNAMDFAHIGQSSPELSAAGKQRSAIFRAGECTIMCSAPEGEGGRAHRYLRKHPDGVGAVLFECENIEGWFERIERAGATPISDIERHQDSFGTLSTFHITTPFGDTTFRFIERKGYQDFFPGMDLFKEPQGGTNQLGFQEIDHVTSNFQTMSPALLWLERVMGFERFWHIEFHTNDVATRRFDDGSGLRSAVMYDRHTGIKFANNEPYRPFFKRSQINIFNEEHRGDGVQHVALSSRDIVAAVRGLRQRGVEFMHTPKTYYEALPERMRRMQVPRLDERLEELEELGILVDGEGPKGYLLQIFLKDSAGLYGEREAGPFFFEVIQRKGDRGFGAGNFRALFESIERDQQRTQQNE